MDIKIMNRKETFLFWERYGPLTGKASHIIYWYKQQYKQ